MNKSVNFPSASINSKSDAFKELDDTTNKLLYIWQMSPNNLCYFCNTEEETLTHLFCKCNIVKNIWNRLIVWFFDKTGIHLHLDDKEKVFGLYSTTFLNELLNTLLIITKQNGQLRK